jgi:hypothetical protein
VLSDMQRQSFNVFKMQRPKWTLQFPSPTLTKLLNFGDCSSLYENSISLLMGRAHNSGLFYILTSMGYARAGIKLAPFLTTCCIFKIVALWRLPLFALSSHSSKQALHSLSNI